MVTLLEDQGSTTVSNGSSQQVVTSVPGCLSLISIICGHQGPISSADRHDEQKNHQYKAIFFLKKKRIHGKDVVDKLYFLMIPRPGHQLMRPCSTGGIVRQGPWKRLGSWESHLCKPLKYQKLSQGLHWSKGQRSRRKN